MAKTYTQIQQQIAVLQQKAEAARRKEIAGVVKRINVAIRHYGLTPGDVDFASAAGTRGATPAKGTGKAKGAGSAKPGGAARKVAPRYRDDAGNTWAGRGSQPRWLRDALANGKTLESFAIK